MRLYEEYNAQREGFMIPESIPVKIQKINSISLVTYGPEEVLKQFKRDLEQIGCKVNLNLTVEDRQSWRADMRISSIPNHARQRIANLILASDLIFYEKPSVYGGLVMAS